MAIPNFFAMKKIMCLLICCFLGLTMACNTAKNGGENNRNTPATPNGSQNGIPLPARDPNPPADYVPPPPPPPWSPVGAGGVSGPLGWFGSSISISPPGAGAVGGAGGFVGGFFPGCANATVGSSQKATTKRSQHRACFIKCPFHIAIAASLATFATHEKN